MWRVAYLVVLSLGCSGLTYADQANDSEFYHKSDLAQYRPNVTEKAGQKRSLREFASASAFCTEQARKLEEQGHVVERKPLAPVSRRGE